MKCPNDDTVLVMTDRQGVEIDYCPQCRGVWLDRGELDKIIERTAAASAGFTQQVAQGKVPPPVRHDTTPRYDVYPAGHQPNYHKKHKDSFLGDLFDF